MVHEGDSSFFFVFKMRCKKLLQLKLKMPGLFAAWYMCLVTAGLIFKSLLCRISEVIFCRKRSCGKGLFLLSPIFLLRYRSKITEDFRDITYVL